MVLGADELEKLLEEIIEKIRQEVFLANRTGELSKVLEKYGLETKDEKYVDRDAKILIIGDSNVSKDQIKLLAKGYGLNTELLEFELDYNKISNFNFVKLKYNTNYSCILIGPMPHSVHGKGDFESIIAKMEKETDKYPEVIRLDNSKGLNITKSTLKPTFKYLYEKYYCKKG